MHVDANELFAAIGRLLDRGGLEEAVPLSTCGRFEMYGVADHPERELHLLRRLMARKAGMSPEALTSHSYVYTGIDAARHLCRVAAGLDSVVYGESQILGQVREAYQVASGVGTSGTYLHRLFQSALFTGKRVRSETEIGRGAASVASAAVSMLGREVGPLESLTAVILGAGETGALVARLLRKNRVGRLIVANRTEERGRQVAGLVGAETASLSELVELLRQADIVVGTLASSPHIVGSDNVDKIGLPPNVNARYFLDLAHPRNFDPELTRRRDARVFDLEHVFGAVDAARQNRAAQVPLAEAIVDEEIQRFDRWLRSRDSVPTLRAVREHALKLAESEAERHGRGRNAVEKRELRRVARSVARSLLHPSTVALRVADPSTPEGRALIDSAHALFGVTPGGIDTSESD